MGRLLRRILYLLRRDRHERELAEEMEYHRAMLARRSLDQGGRTGPAFGNATLAREDARAVWAGAWLDSVRQDLRYTARSLRRQPGFAMSALAILGAAIGLNVSLFTVFNALMQRPWPVPEPARVVSVYDGQMRHTFALAELAYIAERTRTFDALAGTRCIDGGSDGCRVALDDRPASADFVTPNYFGVLRVAMARGAGFARTSGFLGPPDAVAVISHAAWIARFDRDEQIIGRRIRLDDVAFTIVGVASDRFHGVSVERKDIWIPIGAMPLLRSGHEFNDARRTAAVAGRLAPGASREQARAELELLSRQYRLEQRLEPAGVRVESTTFFPNAGRRRMAYSFFALMLTAVLMVLALACANVGNLLLARAVARRREIAVRVSIGAGRARLVRQLVTESLVLAFGGAVIGVGMAVVLPPWLLTQLVGSTALHLTPDASVLLYAAAMAIVACLLFGLAPALHGTRRDLATAMTGDAPVLPIRLRLRSVLLAVQVAVSVVLLVDASLVTRAFQRVAAQDTGFVGDEVSVITFELPASYEITRQRAFAQQLLQRGSAAVAPRPAAFADTAPLAHGGREWTTADLPGGKPGLDQDVLLREISPELFDVLQVPLVAGRTLAVGDAAGHGVVINEAMARRFWPGESALGRTLVSHGDRHVVGIVKDTRMYAGSVTFVGPAMYEPIGGRTIPQMLVKHADAGTIAALRSLAMALEPRALIRVAPLSDNLARLLDEPRLDAFLADALGLLALALAAFGIFSAFAYSVEQRKAELGIRMALGARSSDIVGTVLGSCGHALLAGLVAGVAGAAASGRVIRVFLFGSSPFDPAAYATVAALLAVVSLTATVYPARKATRIDPINALRRE